MAKSDHSSEPSSITREYFRGGSRLSQQAVTRIQRMEQLVGVALVERTARGSSLTGAGALLADWAREVLAAAAVLDAGISCAGVATGG